MQTDASRQLIRCNKYPARIYDTVSRTLICSVQKGQKVDIIGRPETKFYLSKLFLISPLLPIFATPIKFFIISRVRSLSFRTLQWLVRLV